MGQDNSGGSLHRLQADVDQQFSDQSAFRHCHSGSSTKDYLALASVHEKEDWNRTGFHFWNLVRHFRIHRLDHPHPYL